MTIFDCINDILFSKKNKLLNNVDNESDFNQYMISRWCSMYSPNIALVINNTVNWLWNTFETKEQYYKFITTVIPRVRRKHINYIKKTKNTPEEFENVSLLAKRLELSQREIKLYYESQQQHESSSTSTSVP